MNKQKGQSLVEFTLVLPFFLLLIFSLIYTGMLFYDYSTLSNVARTAARERAITDSGISNSTILERYFKVSSDGKPGFTYGLVTSLYKPADANPMTINGPDEKGDIVVTITMTLQDKSSLMEMVLPENYTVVYHMCKDYN